MNTAPLQRSMALGLTSQRWQAFAWSCVLGGWLLGVGCDSGVNSKAPAESDLASKAPVVEGELIRPVLKPGTLTETPSTNPLSPAVASSLVLLL